METHYDAIIIGGGPAGSTCANLLARSGKRVLLLEKERFPRFHIGESITAFGTDLFKELGVYEELKKVNYIRKRGLEFVLHDYTKKLYFPGADRDEDGHLPWAFQMPRDVLDRTLLERAAEVGADVRQEQRVKRVLFEGERAVGVEWEDRSEGSTGEPQRAGATWVLDASGPAGVLNRQMKGNRHDHALLGKKVSIFAHFRADYGFVNGDDEIHFKLCVHRNGRDWAWWLPVGEDLCSVGVILSRETVKERKGTVEELFYETVGGTAFLDEFLGDRKAEVVDDKFHTITDYSYQSKQHIGDGWALVGDSAGFIDPVFSTGLQITFNSAFRLSETLLGLWEDESRRADLLREYDRAVDRYYRVNGTLVHLFYLAQIDPHKFEDPAYMWKKIPFASWRYRLKFLYWGARLAFKKEETRRRMGEEVVFGNPSPGNLVAEQFLMLSRNFDEVYADEIRAVQEQALAT